MWLQEKKNSERLKHFFFQGSEGSSLWKEGCRIWILLQLKKKEVAPTLIEK